MEEIKTQVPRKGTRDALYKELQDIRQMMFGMKSTHSSFLRLHTREQELVRGLGGLEHDNFWQRCRIEGCSETGVVYKNPADGKLHRLDICFKHREEHLAAKAAAKRERRRLKRESSLAKGSI